MNHVLKTHAEHFAKVWEGDKPFEIRVDDREPRFAVGDKVYLREWDAATGQELPRWIGARVTCAVRGPIAGLADGYCVLGLTDFLCCFGSWSKSDTAGRLRDQSFTRTRGVA